MNRSDAVQWSRCLRAAVSTSPGPTAPRGGSDAIVAASAKTLGDGYPLGGPTPRLSHTIRSACALPAQLLILIPLLCLLSACSDIANPPSALERFDGMASQLDSVTLSTHRVSADLSTLARQMSRAQPTGVQRTAGILRHDGELLRSRSGESGASIRLLLAADRTRIQRTYFRRVLTALKYEWDEGNALTHLAQLVWRDPLLLNPRNATRLLRLDRDVQWYAWRSVQSVTEADSWRRTHIRSFRYTPSPSPARLAAGPYL